MKRKFRNTEQWRKRIVEKKISTESDDLGYCFGADVGGTLAKLVFFEEQHCARPQRRSVTSRTMPFFFQPRLRRSMSYHSGRV